MKKKMLISGGGYADIPIIKAAKQLGFYVITSGLDENGLGNIYSDKYCKADNSDREAIADLAQDLKVDAICPSAAGLSALSCSYAAERLGIEHLDRYSAAQTLHYKDKFQAFAKEHGIPTPKADSFTDPAAAGAALAGFGFPLIIKPVDLSGGKGIFKANDLAEAEAALKNAFALSRTSTILIEEFIEGSNHGFSSILNNGKVIFSFHDNEYYYLNKFTVAGATAPGDVPREAEKKLIAAIEKIAALLRLKNGIFHLQFILRNNEPYIIDICRRVPGDLYIEFVKHATGIDYPSFIVKGFAGMDIEGIKSRPINGYYTRHVIMGHKNGRLKRVTYGRGIKDLIIDEFMILKSEDKITNYMSQRLGIVFFRCDSKAEIEEKNKNIQEMIKVEIEE